MPRTRLLVSTALLCLAFAVAAAPSATAASAVGPAKALRGPTKGSSKQALEITTGSPVAGSTLTGKVTWQVTVAGATPSRVDFAVDGTVAWSQAAAPYVFGGNAGTLDTTQLSNGSHTLTATAYGARGVKASTQVTVTVANTAPAEEAALKEESGLEPLPETEGGPIYWGATIGAQLTGTPAPWDMTAVSKFEEATRRPLSLVQFFQPFSTCSGGTCSFYSFPWTPLEDIRQHGSMPVVSWNSQSIPSSVNEPDYQLSDIISGRYDSYIREFAAKAKAWGHPFFLRFDWEMNGNWFPWSEGVNGNKAGEYATAWRHVHNIFSEVGATNVTWVWCPNVDWDNNLQSVGSTYPGDAYVDWVGLDGYNWGTNPSRPGKWETFDQLYRGSYRYLVETVASTKPMMLAEVASTEYGGSKAGWIREMLTKISSEYHDIRAVVWFDKYDDGMDWPIESSSTATAAFAEGIQSPSYVGNLFSTLSTSVIQPAS